MSEVPSSLWWTSPRARSLALVVVSVAVVNPTRAAAEPARVAPSERTRAREDALPPAPRLDLVTPTWHSLGLMTGMRLTEAWLWPNPFAETRLSVLSEHYGDAFSHAPKWSADRAWFESDGDRWQINVLGHAAFGAELYYRPRRCGASPWLALGFATLSSAVWEYGFEANGVRPSALDLWYTPISGAVLGEARFWGYKAASKIHAPWARTTVQVLLDPFGELERTLGAPC